MKGSGHEGVAKDVGLPMLEEAFGDDKKSLKAFYLGNWLTDMSQLVDPVAYASVRDGIGSLDFLTAEHEKLVDRIFDSFIAEESIARLDIDEALINTVREALVDAEELAAFEEAHVEIKTHLTSMLNALFIGATDGRESKLGLVVRQTFFIIGYFKFVHPEGTDDRERMDYDAYKAVFGEPGAPQGDRFIPGSARPDGTMEVALDATDRPGGYTQYYPHEHMDRPHVGPGERDFAPGPQRVNRPFRIGATPGPGSLPGKAGKPGPRSRSGAKEVTPDLYSYLRDHIECTAGLLAEADDAFARALAQGFDDTDPEWHQILAKTGHALHQVEDFFAHSNFAELAATQLGPDYLDKILPSKIGPDFLYTTNDIFDRRLRRYVNTVGVMEQKEFESINKESEDWVVTGFFDFLDTANSILHMSEATVGLEAHDPTTYVHDGWESLKAFVRDPSDKVDEVKETLRDTLDFVTDPKAEWDNDDNSVAKRFKEPYDEWITSVTRETMSDEQIAAICRDIPLLKSVPHPEVIGVFVNVVILATKVDKLKEPVEPLWSAWKEVRDFLSRPYAYIAEKVSEFLADKLKAVSLNLLKFFGKDLVFEHVLGSKRIGCHSLLSKDHGNELLYAQARECAAAVHWYVMHTLLRDRSDPDVPEQIDWLELLEHFLTNPMAAEEGEKTEPVRLELMASRVIVTSGGDQLDSPIAANSLTKRFSSSTAAPYRLTWRDIADANFGTKGRSDAECRAIVNAVLRTSEQGYPVAKPNYAFRPGVPLVIPYQTVFLVSTKTVEHEPAWWRRVITEKDWTVLRGREEKQMGLSTAPYAGHVLQEFLESDHQAQIDRGKALRIALRRQYRSAFQRVGPGRATGG